jgi:hypothetical protein
MPITVLSHNPAKTVGLVTGENPPKNFICEFDPLALKEWVEQIVEHFGDSKPVFVSAHPSGIVDVMALGASDAYGDELQVFVVGFEKQMLKDPSAEKL